MSLRPCRVCGRVDRRRMIALMTQWFGRYADVPPDGGYFYLCPSCHLRLIDPHLADIRHKLASEHPSIRRIELPPTLLTRGPRPDAPHAAQAPPAQAPDTPAA